MIFPEPLLICHGYGCVGLGGKLYIYPRGAYADDNMPVAGGGSGGSDEPPFSRTPLQKLRTPLDLNISNSISNIVFQLGPLMSMSNVSTSIQHNFYDRLLGLLLTALRTPFNILYEATLVSDEGVNSRI